MKAPLLDAGSHGPGDTWRLSLLVVLPPNLVPSVGPSLPLRLIALDNSGSDGGRLAGFCGSCSMGVLLGCVAASDSAVGNWGSMLLFVCFDRLWC